MQIKGRIVKQISNLYTVESDNNRYECSLRGKFRNDKITPLVGDFVVFDNVEKVIESILPRKNSLNRPTIANVDVALIITSAKKPDINLSLLDKEIVCIENESIEPVICITKVDLLDKKEKKEIKNIINMYRTIGYKVLTNRNLFKLRRLLKGKEVVLTGQTGAGKSTLINRLDKSFNLDTSPISEALGRGVHTTRHTEIYNVKGSFIADTPGFSALDLNIKKDELKNLFREFKGISCKFDDCMHINEKDCNIKKLVENGTISKSRYDNYVKMWSDLK